MIEEIIKERVLILDGGMGTMIQRYGLSEQDFRGERFADIDWQMKGNNDILNLTRPDVIEDIHRKYLEAGADLIETCTFSAQRISMADYHVAHLCREINLAACRVARKVVDEYSRKTPGKPRFVIGALGPTNKTCSISPDVENPAFRAVTFDEMKEAYKEQIDALMDGGVDALMNETIFDTLNAKAFCVAAEEVFAKKRRKLPLMLSVTVSDRAGRTLSGQTLRAFLVSVEPGREHFSVIHHENVTFSEIVDDFFENFVLDFSGLAVKHHQFAFVSPSRRVLGDFAFCKIELEL